MFTSTQPHPGELLVQARAGSSPALGQLLERYRCYLNLLVRLRIGAQLQSKVDASDVVQETFLEAHRRFARFRGTTEAELLGWLRGILAGTLSHLTDHYLGTQRRNLRLECRLLDALVEPSHIREKALVSAQSSPSQQAARREQAALLANALDQLPQPYREVILLHHFQGLTFGEAARHMGRTVESVKKLWPRALARLGQTMGAAP